MISALHLIWIIPLCAIIGYVIACLMWAASEKKKYQPKGGTN